VKFYVTFGSGHAGDLYPPQPAIYIDADCVLEIEVEDEVGGARARGAVIDMFGTGWSDLYSEETMVWHPEGMPEHSYYPRGVVGRIIPTHIEAVEP
jgi:hypothetical protein